jgi:hypothetical protein
MMVASKTRERNAMSARTISLSDERVIADVLRTTDGVASVYFGQSSTPDLEWHARWQALAGRLIEAGASEAVVAAVERAVALASPVSAAMGASGLAVFAGRTGEPVVLHTPGLAGPDHATWGPVARVAPVLAWLRDRPPYVLVVTDRAGADIETGAGGCHPPRSRSVLGPDDEIERNAPGGWAQLRYQHRAEDSWRHNARAVAEACERELRDGGARLLVVSGDVRAVQLLEDRLPEQVDGPLTIRHITGGRSNDGSQQHRHDTVAEIARAAAGDWTAELLARFAEQRSPRGLAVDGELATLEALGQGRIAVLLVENRDGDSRTAWFGPEPTQVRPTTETPPPSWASKDRGPLVDVAIRAALLAGAEVRVLDPGTRGAPAEGIGGLCRFH